MNRTLRILATTGILTAASLSLRGATIPQIAAPVLGYVFDAELAGIRPIAGVPGAASLDAPLDLGVGLQGAFINSIGKSAIGIAKDGSTVVIRWGSGQPSVTPMETAFGRVTMASVSGSFAVLSDGLQVEVWSNLADQPSRVAGYSNLAGAVTAVAINSTGAAVIANGGGQIQTLQNGSATVIAASGKWTSLVWSGRDVLATDGQANQLIRIADASGTPASSVIATFGDAPASSAVSRDGALAAVILKNEVALVDGSGTVTPLNCSCQPKNLQMMEGNLVLYLTGTGLLLDADTPGARLVTLPNAPSDAAANNGDSAQ